MKRQVKNKVNKINFKFLLLGTVFILTLAGWFQVSEITSAPQSLASSQIQIHSETVAYNQLAQDAAPALIKVNADEALAKPNPLGEIVLGDPSAPVTVIEYASLTCGHCGAFHNQVLPEIKRDYVDKGLVKFYFRPFPFDGVATAGAMLAQCVAPGARLTFLDLLFKRQTDLLQSPDPFGQLQSFAKQAGLSEGKFMACLESQETLDAIREMQAIASRDLGVNSTPTFFIKTY